ncbi:universal stress protein family [Legionella sainthelensi]|nr:universal stress protein family [Legionella sainthelensi]
MLSRSPVSAVAYRRYFNSQYLKGNSVGILESKTENIMEQLDHFLKNVMLNMINLM